MSYRYANMLNRCAENHTRLRNALFFLARSFLKKLLMAFLPAQIRAIYVICVYFDQLHSQISPQSKISIANINKIQCLLSGIHLIDNFRQCTKDVRARSKMAVPIRPPRKHRFFIKLTISQYHDIDISYIDIDIGKNAFSMTSLPFMWYGSNATYEYSYSLR